MNPNSSNQWWGKWTFTVSQTAKGHSRLVTRTELETHFARFARSLFGTAGQARIDRTNNRLVLQMLIEGGNVVPHDPFFVEHVRQRAAAFFTKGLGAGITVSVEAKLMAGSRQDGTPSEQLLIIPAISDPDLGKEATFGKRTLQPV
jgi:hypothetical protein